MALWYNSKKQEYASDGKNGWFKKYCDKLVSELREICEAHFAGFSNRHKSADVDYDAAGEATVKDKLDALDGKNGELAKELESEKEARKTADVGLGTRIDTETNNRISADNALGKRIDGEISDRKNADTALEQKITAEVNSRGQADVLLGKRIDSETSARQNADNLKADRGTVTESTIDTTLDAGVYTAKDVTVRYYCGVDDQDENGAEDNDPIDFLYVTSDDRYVHQLALIVGSTRRCLVVRTYNKSAQTWGKWFRIDNDFERDIIALMKDVNKKANQGYVSQDDADSLVLDELTENGIYSIDYYSGHWTDIPLASVSGSSTKQQYEPSGLFVFKKAVSNTITKVYQIIFGIQDGSHGCFIYREKNDEKSGSWSSWQYVDDDVRSALFNKADFKNSSSGFNGGDQSSATEGGGAVGRLAKTTSGGAVGSESESKNGFAGGYHVKVTGMGAAIGANAHAYHGGAVGSGAQAGNGFAGGYNAKCGTETNGADIDCIQLGTGTNGKEKTLKIYDYQVTERGDDGSIYLKDVGKLKDLKTVSKTNIVEAVNEVQMIKDAGVITDGRGLNELTSLRIFRGTFNITDPDPDYALPGIGKLSDCDFILKAYPLTNYDLEDYVYQELYFVDGTTLKCYTRFYDHTTETWSDFVKSGDGVNTVSNPFVMKGKYDTGISISCTDEPASDNCSWILEYTVPQINITSALFGNIKLNEQDIVYEGLRADDKGKTYSVFAEYKNNSGFSDAAVVIEQSPICKKDYAVLKSSDTLSYIRLYLGDIKVNDIIIGGPMGPDGIKPESSADISFTYSKEKNPEIYILGYDFIIDNALSAAEINGLKSEIAALKKSVISEVTTIGAGLKVESGTLSVDCATTDETSAAVSGVLNQ